MGLKHQAVSARKWRSAIRQVERHFPAHLPPLLFLTDPDRTPDPIAAIKTLPEGSGVIYRHFGSSDRFETGARIAAVCRARKLSFLIAADPSLAAALEADGVHWPEKQLHHARHWRGYFQIQTASAHSRRAISRAAQAGIDAVLVSAVFPSRSPSAGAPLGAARLRRLSRIAPLPLYGLGGVSESNAARIANRAGLSGISGIAG